MSKLLLTIYTYIFLSSVHLIMLIFIYISLHYISILQIIFLSLTLYLKRIGTFLDFPMLPLNYPFFFSWRRKSIPKPYNLNILFQHFDLMMLQRKYFRFRNRCSFISLLYFQSYSVECNIIKFEGQIIKFEFRFLFIRWRKWWNLTYIVESYSDWEINSQIAQIVAPVCGNSSKC